MIAFCIAHVNADFLPGEYMPPWSSHSSAWAALWMWACASAWASLASQLGWSPARQYQAQSSMPPARTKIWGTTEVSRPSLSTCSQYLQIQGGTVRTLGSILATSAALMVVTKHFVIKSAEAGAIPGRGGSPSRDSQANSMSTSRLGDK